MESFKTSFFAEKKEEKKYPLLRRRHVAPRQEKRNLSPLKQRLVFSQGQGRYLPPELIDRICSFLNLNSILDVNTLAIFARFGNQDAQARLGYAYLRGINTEENRLAATQWLNLAKQQDATSAPGLWALGLCHEWGFGLPKDPIKACRILMENRNYAPALLDGGRLLLHIARDSSEDGNTDQATEMLHTAIILFTRSAILKRYPLAQFVLGQCYQHGLGVPENNKLALNYIIKSAEQGLIAAQRYLAYYYDNEVTREEVSTISYGSIRALKWYSLLAKQKNNSKLVRRRACMLRVDAIAMTLFFLFGTAALASFFVRLCFIESPAVKDEARTITNLLATLMIASSFAGVVNRFCLKSSPKPKNSPTIEFL